MIRTVTCTIRIDEDLLDCDFSYPAASIEEAIHAWEGLKVVRWDDPAPPDSNALDIIARTLSGSEWTPDMFDAIADLVRATGRTIADV